MVRQGFPLFTGSQLNVSIHKSWTTYPLFVIICWKKIKTHIVGVRKKKRMCAHTCEGHAHRMRKGNKRYKPLRNCANWKRVLSDSVLLARVVKNFSSIKQTFNGFKDLNKLSPLKPLLTEYLSFKKDWKKVLPYTSLLLKDRALAVSWLSENFSFTWKSFNCS